MLSPPHILIETLSSFNFDLVRRFEKAGYSISLFNITTDVCIPSVLAVSRSNSPEVPSLLLATSCALNPEDAVRKSLEELEHVRYYAQPLLARKLLIGNF
jgi:ribosomal protein S12 methylthiotransferase accessory factor